MPVPKNYNQYLLSLSISFLTVSQNPVHYWVYNMLCTNFERSKTLEFFLALFFGISNFANVFHSFFSSKIKIFHSLLKAKVLFNKPSNTLIKQTHENTHWKCTKVTFTVYRFLFCWMCWSLVKLKRVCKMDNCAPENIVKHRIWA